jgi:hypothetical protein
MAENKEEEDKEDKGREVTLSMTRFEVFSRPNGKGGREGGRAVFFFVNGVGLD